VSLGLPYSLPQWQIRTGRRFLILPSLCIEWTEPPVFWTWTRVFEETSLFGLPCLFPSFFLVRGGSFVSDGGLQPSLRSPLLRRFHWAFSIHLWLVTAHSPSTSRTCRFVWNFLCRKGKGLISFPDSHCHHVCGLPFGLIG